MKRALIVLFSVIGVAAIGGLAYWLVAFRASSSPEEMQRQRFSENLQAGRQLLSNGVGGTALDLLEQAVMQAANPAQKSRAELNLGSAYVQAGMPQKGIDLWKQISINASYPVAYRSTATQDVLSYYISGKDVDFALSEIFTGPVWGGFIKGQSPDLRGLNLAFKNALLWIDSFEFPNHSFIIQYRLANWYGEDMLIASGTAKEYDLSQARHYIQRGDAAYDRALATNTEALKKSPNDLPPYVDSILGVGLTLKARTVGAMYLDLVKVGGVTFDHATSLFKEAIGLSERRSGTASYSRFHFAEFLELADPVANKQQILDALAPLYTATNRDDATFYQDFLKRERADARYHDTLSYRHLVGLSKIDPRFKSLLISLGWKSSDLE